MIGSFLEEVKILKVEDSVADGQAATVSDVVDTQGYGGACFVYKLGAVTDAGAVTLKVYGDGDAAFGSPTELSGGAAAIAVTSGDSEQSLVVDIKKPQERYLRATLTTATQDSGIDSGFCFLYNPIAMPITQPATIDDSALAVSPGAA